MLESLTVRDLALLEEVTLEPGSGLNCLTGETGAGKSLLIGAIQAIHGARMGRDWIREGADKATIEAVFVDVFDLLEPEMQERYFGSTEEPGEDLLILYREIRRKGSTVCRINGDRVNLRDLKEIGSLLSQIHGQHEQQTIFDEREQLILLDRLGGEPIQLALANWQKTYQELRQVEKAQFQMIANPEKRKRLLTLLERQMKRIDQVDPQKGELAELQKRRSFLEATLQGAETLQECMGYLSGSFSGEEEMGPDALSLIQAAKTSLRDAQKRLELDALEPLEERLDSLQDELMDFDAELAKLSQQLEFNPSELQKTNQRIQSLIELEESFGRSIDELLDYRQVIEEKHEALLNSDLERQELLKKEKRLQQTLLDQGTKLSTLRKETGEHLVEGVQAALADLAMPHAKFSLQWTKTEPGPQGQDHLAFYFTANPGEKAKPLANVASGGEASRIMLAIKVVLAEADRVPLLIFDEIDQGISGNTAAQVGRQLANLGKSHQILCVTHQAQVAVQAKQHFHIAKQVSGGRTRTQIKRLDEDERVEELARLLGASLAESEAKALAREMLSQVHSE